MSMRVLTKKKVKKRVCLTNSSVQVLEDSGAMIQGHVELGLRRQTPSHHPPDLDLLRHGTCDVKLK